MAIFTNSRVLSGRLLAKNFSRAPNCLKKINKYVFFFDAYPYFMGFWRAGIYIKNDFLFFWMREGGNFEIAGVCEKNETGRRGGDLSFDLDQSLGFATWAKGAFLAVCWRVMGIACFVGIAPRAWAQPPRLVCSLPDSLAKMPWTPTIIGDCDARSYEDFFSHEGESGRMAENLGGGGVIVVCRFIAAIPCLGDRKRGGLCL